MDMSIIIALFGIGILALTLQIAMTTKKEWFAFLSFAAVFTIFLLLIVNFPWFGGIISGVFELILKLIPWLIGGFLIFMLVMTIVTANAYWEHNAPLETSLLIQEGKLEEAEEFLIARAKKHRRSKEKLAVILQQLKYVRKLKEGRTKPETAETPIKLLPAQSIKVKGLLPVGPTLS